MWTRVLCLALVAVTFAATAAQAQRYTVTIQTRQSEEIRGRLLQITPDGVRVDPEGPTSFLLVRAERISSVYVHELEKTLTYPLTAEQIPASLSGDLRATPEYRGYPSFAVIASLGIIGAGIPGEEGYYEGFGAGPTIHLRLRYFFRRLDPRDRRFFAGLSYYHSTLRPDGELLASSGATGGFGDLQVQHYALELGGTGRMTGRGSSGYFLLGFALLKNSTGVSEQSGTVSQAVTSSQTREAVRFELGGVIGLTPRLGLVLNGGVDFLYAGVEENVWGQDRVKTDGLLPSLTFGLQVGL